MGKLAFIAIHLNRLEVAFLQDNVQAFRHEVKALATAMEQLPGENLPIHDEAQEASTPLALDGPESWL